MLRVGLVEFACKKNAGSLHVYEFVSGVVRSFIKKETDLPELDEQKKNQED
jgi:hypothetical protein